MKHLLIMDDDIAFAEIVKDRFIANEYKVSIKEECTCCMQYIEELNPSIVLLDINFGSDNSRREGVEALKKLRSRFSREELPIVMLSGTGDAKVLASTLKIGADDYYYKPIEEFEEVIEKINALINRTTGNPDEYNVKQEEPVLGGSSKAIMEKNKEIIQAAQAGIDTFFWGETGTGKEVAAELYHYHSSRNHKPMVVVNCPTFTEAQFEAHVYGAQKGSYTGLDSDRRGLVEEAEGGIIFFDEIGYLPLDQQKKLLRFLDKKEYTSLGSNTVKKANVIILAATNVNLEESVKQGLFQEDLHYRLQVNVIKLLPLRGRTNDIVYLVNEFFNKYNNKNIQTIDHEVYGFFKQMRWTGNVRQLKNCIENSIHKCKSHTLGLKDVEGFLVGSNNYEWDPMEIIRPKIVSMNYSLFDAFEKDIVIHMRVEFYNHHLKENNWNISRTAQKLGMSKEYLRQVLKKCNIQKDQL